MVKYTLKEKILKLLIENNKPFSIREISKQLNTDYKNTSQALNRINPEIITKQKQGNSYSIQFNPNNEQETLVVERKRTNEFLSKNSKLNLIKQDTEEIKYPFIIVLIFGSFAKGKNTPNSDIDVCIISDKREKTKNLIQKLNLHSLNLEIHEFTSSEFISMIEKKQDNLGNEIIKSNIIIYGIENYYNLIKWIKKV